MKCPVCAEQLRHIISIKRKSTTPDEYSDPEKTLIDVAADIHAFVDPTGGSEFFAAQKINSEANYNVWIRYRLEILPSMVVIYNDKTFEIISVIDLYEAHRWIRLICKELI
jgi:SPP1 family predicted phage head-tail adaptor